MLNFQHFPGGLSFRPPSCATMYDHKISCRNPLAEGSRIAHAQKTQSFDYLVKRKKRKRSIKMIDRFYNILDKNRDNNKIWFLLPKLMSR